MIMHETMLWRHGESFSMSGNFHFSPLVAEKYIAKAWTRVDEKLWDF